MRFCIHIGCFMYKKRSETDLKHRVIILHEIETTNSIGEPVVTEVVVCSTWAAIWPKSAKESMINGQEAGSITHRIRIRYRPGIAHNMRIRFGDRLFKIVAQPINMDESNKWLDILATEGI